MYGVHVHQAVLASGERETGVSIHLVDEEYGHGEVIAQCACRSPRATPSTSLAQRVLEREHSFLVEILEAIEVRRLKLPGGIAMSKGA
jgi:phosphoribosylglycinamide formyltransferase-1